jgi:HK97 family phage prohead protease
LDADASKLQGIGAVMEQKISRDSETKVLDEKQGIVEAFVNTMGVVDSDGDIITSDAFDKSFSNLPIPVLAGHDQSEVVGKVLSAKAIPSNGDEGPHRLHATMQMNMETQSGREAFSNVSGDYVREWSVGFNMMKDGAKFETLDGNPVRVISDLDWVEASTVIRGASPETQTISSKSEEIQSASDTVEDTASDTEVIDYDYGKAELDLLKLKLRLSKANKEA